jgi:hypothetical protein
MPGQCLSCMLRSSGRRRKSRIDLSEIAHGLLVPLLRRDLP